MPAHDVTMNLSHPITVKNVDVEFEVRSDGELKGQGPDQQRRNRLDTVQVASTHGDLGAVRRVDGGIRLAAFNVFRRPKHRQERHEARCPGGRSEALASEGNDPGAVGVDAFPVQT